MNKYKLTFLRDGKIIIIIANFDSIIHASSSIIYQKNWGVKFDECIKIEKIYQ